MGVSDRFEFRGVDRTDELRPVTALFADVVGSTRLGERLAPSEVKALIGECVSRMCEAIEGYGGCVRSYMGDGVAGFFGIDAASEDDIERAARAALDIRELMHAYAAEVKVTWGIPDFSVRVGVNVGRVAVGDVGSAIQPQRVALGDAVNVAARLQSMAEPGGIVVGGHVAANLGDRFVLKHLGSVAVKGRESVVEAYELQSRDSAARHPDGSRPLIGRVSELTAIEEAIRELRKGRGQVCFVLGEAGIGKSRLVQEVRHRVTSDVLWLRGSCDSMDERLPYEPVVQPLRCWLSVDVENAAPIATRIRLGARGDELLGSGFKDVAPFLARLLGVGLGTKMDRRLDGLPLDVLKSGLSKAYLRWLRTLATTRPVVLAMDNFESVSEASAEVLHDVMSHLAAIPVLLVLTMRTEARAPARSVRTRALNELVARSLDVHLRPLDAEETANFVELLDSDGALDNRLRLLIAERSEGNPLYAEQLFGAIAADRTASAPETALPDPLVSLLLARIDRLPPDARTLLQCAAVLGRSFTSDDLVAMAGVDRFEDGLELLLRSDLIRESSRSPRTFVFRHGLLRDAALSTLSAAKLRVLNGLAAVAIRESTTLESQRRAEQIARHYLASGDLGNAVEYLEKLADKYALVSRCAEAVELIEKCVAEVVLTNDEMALVRLVQKQSQALALMGDVDGAIRVLVDAEAAVSDDDGRRELAIAKARHLVERGALDEADATLELLVSTDGVARLDPRIVTLASKIALDRGDLDRADELVSELGDLSLLSGGIGFEALSVRSGVLLSRGCLDEAEFWALRAQAIADRTAQIALQLTARRRVALVCLLKGCLPEGYERMKAVYEECARLGFSSGMVEGALNVLYVANQIGKLAEGAEIGAEALEVAPSPLLEGLLAANLAATEILRGDNSRGRHLAQRVLSLQDLLPTWAQVAARISLAYAALAEQDESTCEALLLEGFDIAASQGAEREQAALANSIASFYLDIERPSDAAPFAAFASERIEFLDKPMSLDLRRAEILLKGVSDEDLVAELALVLAEARSSGLLCEEALTLIELAKCDSDRTDEHLAAAEAIIRDSGAKFYLRYLPDRARASANAL